MDSMMLATQAKWLLYFAQEIFDEGHSGWGNTCRDAAEAIDAHISRQAAMKQAHAELLQSHREVVEQHAAMVAKLREVITEMRDVATFNHAKADDFKNRWADELDAAIGDRT